MCHPGFRRLNKLEREMRKSKTHKIRNAWEAGDLDPALDSDAASAARKDSPLKTVSPIIMGQRMRVSGHFMMNSCVSLFSHDNERNQAVHPDATAQVHEIRYEDSPRQNIKELKVCS